MSEEQKIAAAKYRQRSQELAEQYVRQATLWLAYYNEGFSQCGDNFEMWLDLKRRIKELENELKRLRWREINLGIDVDGFPKSKIVYGRKAQSYARHLKQLVNEESPVVWWLLTHPTREWMSVLGWGIR